MKIRKYNIVILLHSSDDHEIPMKSALCSERIVNYRELRDIVDVIEQALCLGVPIQYHVYPYYEEVPDNA